MIMQRHDFHMPDGEEQQKRDEVFLSQLGKEIKGAFPSRWYAYVSLEPFLLVNESSRTCPEVQPWLYGYDAIKEADDAIKRNGQVFKSVL